MKAKIRATGEVIEVKCETIDGNIFTEISSTHHTFKQYHKNELDFGDSKDIDWEQRKWDAALAITAAYKSNSDQDTIEWKAENMVRNAISTANELIKQLKQHSDEK